MRILVRFHPDASDGSRADAVRSVGGWIDAEIAALGVTRIALPGGASDAFGDGPAVAAALARHPAVAFAEHDGTVRLLFEPNDPYYKDDPVTDLGQWGIRKASVNKAWDTVRGSSNVTVAILDTGVDPDHPDLAGALAEGKAFVTQPSSECDEEATKDDNAHGTHVAGIVGARGNDKQGIAGVAFGVKVMPLKVLDCKGLGSLSDVAAGLVWAVDHGAKIVNLSLGAPFETSTLRSAVSYATEKGVLVVSAVGNCATSGERCTMIDQIDYPAAYPEVLGVGATDVDDTVAFFSSRNSTVDVVAPGRLIVSTTPRYSTYRSRLSEPVRQGYDAFSGTSQASPFAAAIAALVWSAEPGLTAEQVRERIVSTADDLGAKGRDDDSGSGRVNAQRAVTPASEKFGVTYDTSALPKSVAVGTSFVARVGVTNTSSFAWKATGATPVRLDWSWLDASGAPVPGPSGALPLAADVATGARATVTGTIDPPGTAGAFRLRLDLARGATSFSSKGVAAATLATAVGSGLGATYAPAAGSATFDAGTTIQVPVALTNTGTVPWPAAGATPFRLSYHWLQAGSVVQWDGLRAPLPADVAPGAKVAVTLPVMPPAKPGTYTLRIDLVHEGVAWLSDLGVAPHDLTASVRGAYVATYTVSAAPVLLPGGRASVAVTLANTGTRPWPASGPEPVRLATHVTDARGDVITWDGPRTALSADVAPGGRVATAVTVDAPAAPGPYRVRVDLVREGIEWFSSLGVATADIDLLVAADYRAALPSGPLTVSAGSPVAQVTVTNSGIATWSAEGAAPVLVGVHWYDAARNVLVWDGPRTALPGAVTPGGTVSISVQLGPVPDGAAFVAIDPVSEGVRWFGAGPLRPVTFAP